MSLGPCTHVPDTEVAPGSLLETDTALVIVTICGVTQWMEDLCLSLYLSFYNSDFQIKQIKNNNDSGLALKYLKN